jgi:exodeoxyribonuclease VII large subunit
MMDDLLMPPVEEVLDVTALTRKIKRQLEDRFAQVWVRGEISNLRRQSSGHVYFSLKDKGSQLPCVLFAGDAARQSFELVDGMEVMLLGSISVYEPHGRYQLIAKIAIQSGEGRLQIEYERLKRKLAAEGLFDRSQKRELPLLPKRIAVITSPTGAAVRDFLRILKRRGFLGEVTIFPARVQGKGSTNEVAAMLEHANASIGFDLVVLTRGGGSIEDLWAFNKESLARAVAASKLPVISAIGHEIDHVLTDFAADMRAETPSGAAELISSLYLNITGRVEQFGEDLNAALEDGLKQLQIHTDSLKARLSTIAPARQVQLLQMQIDEIENRLLRSIETRAISSQRKTEGLSQRLLRQHPKLRLELAQQKMASDKTRLIRASRQHILNQNSTLKHLATRLNNSSLQATLDRGYAVLQAQDGRILPDTENVRCEKTIRARLRDGEVELSHNTTSKKS